MKTLYLSIIVAIGIIICVSFGLVVLISKPFVSSESRPSGIDTLGFSSGIFELKNTTWISVMSIEKNQTRNDYTHLDKDFLEKIPKLKNALSGADLCKEGKNICSIPSGVSTEMLLEGAIPVVDYLNYQASLTPDEAQSLFDKMRLIPSGNVMWGDVEFDDKYYQLVLQTSNDDISPQVMTEFFPVPHNFKVRLEPGQSVNYTILVQTLATFGKPAEISFSASSTARDSGLKVDVIPHKIVIPERSNATINLIVKADSSTRNGSYSIGVSGQVDNKNQMIGPGYMDSYPIVQIGNSDWQITEFGNDTTVLSGGNDPPGWLKNVVTTDKKEYHDGDIVEIKPFVINTSSKKITLDKNLRLDIIVYHQNKRGTYQYLYTIDAIYEGTPITLEPNSKTLVARAFYWDQKTFSYSILPHRLEPGDYKIDMSFSGLDDAGLTGVVLDNETTVKLR